MDFLKKMISIFLFRCLSRPLRSLSFLFLLSLLSLLVLFIGTKYGLCYFSRFSINWWHSLQESSTHSLGTLNELSILWQNCAPVSVRLWPRALLHCDDFPILPTFQMKPFTLRKCSRHKISILAQYLIFVDKKTLVDQDEIFFWEDFVVFHNNLEVCHIYNSVVEGEIWLTFNLAGLLIYFPKLTQQCIGFVRQSY